ncbi:MAG: hypothetical protein ACYC8T_24170 [Myxococcaceae bacterium]
MGRHLSPGQDDGGALLASRARRALLSLCAAVLLAACSHPGGASDAGATDAGPPPESAFGVFAVFTDEYAPFRQSLGLDFRGYQDWAGARMNELGAQWTRSNLQLTWDVVEPVKGGAFDWKASFGGDDVFGGATRSGVHYLAVFHEGNGPTSPTGKPPLRNPLDDLPGYQRFVEAAVERYDGDGVDDAPGGIVIKHWQAGNETDGWTRSGRSNSDYVRWFEATAEAIHRADPEARLVLIASTDANKVDPLHTEAINGLAARGVRFDAIDLHHWGRGDLTGSKMGAVPQYQAALAGAGLNGVELWSCEHGTYVGTPAGASGQCSRACPVDKACAGPMGCVPRCASDASCPAQAPRCNAATGLCGPPAQTQEDQARSLIYRYAINRGQGVKRILWNNLAAWQCFGGICGGMFDLMGLVADGHGPGEVAADVGKPRLAFHAYRRLTQLTDEPVAEQLGEVSTGDATAHVYAYRDRATGQTGLVAWANTAHPITLDFAAERAQLTSLITDAAGQPLRDEKFSAAAGKLTVSLDADPVWIFPAP